MAQRYDVSLKALFLREGDGIIRRLLFHGRVTEFLATEQPRISNLRTDLVVRTEDRSLHHVEFQSDNEASFALRMLEYYGYLVRTYGEHVWQTVLYLGRDPLRMEKSFASPVMQYRFEIVNLRELDAAPLLASSDWLDNVLALLAKGNPEEALAVVIPRIAALRDEDQQVASTSLLLLSGIIGFEGIVNRRLKEIGMINVMENKVLGPMILEKVEQGRAQGRTEGRTEGRHEGKYEILREQLSERFGLLPSWASSRLASASDDDLKRWSKRILSATTLDETLA